LVPATHAGATSVWSWATVAAKMVVDATQTGAVSVCPAPEIWTVRSWTIFPTKVAMV
jgi:hypothetical protein